VTACDLEQFFSDEDALNNLHINETATDGGSKSSVVVHFAKPSVYGILSR